MKIYHINAEIRYNDKIEALMRQMREHFIFANSEYY